MKISARGRYSMQALFDLAHHSHGEPVPLHLIAERQKLSLPFLEQIFHKLKKAGVVRSVRGPKGGYVLTRPCDQVSIGEILRLTDQNLYAISRDDPEHGRKILLEDERMSDLLWRQMEEHMTTFMEKVTIADLCAETHSNTCPVCTCPEYVHGAIASTMNGKQKGCAVLMGEA